MENNQIPEPEKRIDLVAAWNRKQKGRPWHKRLADHFKKKEHSPQPYTLPHSLENRMTADAEQYPGIKPAGYVPLIQNFTSRKPKDISKDKRPSFLEGLVIGTMAAIIGMTVGVKYGPQIQSRFQGEKQAVEETDPTKRQEGSASSPEALAAQEEESVSFIIPDILYLDVYEGDTASELYADAINTLRQRKRPLEDYMASMLYRKMGFIQRTEETYGLDLDKIRPGDRIPLDLNLLPKSYQNVITRARTLRMKTKPYTNGTRTRELIEDYLEENGIPALSSLIDGKGGIEERMTAYNETLQGNTQDRSSFLIDPTIITSVLEARMAKKYISSMIEIGERYAKGESASSIAKDYATPELQDLKFIRQVGWNRVRYDGSIRAYDRRMFTDADKTFADLYAKHGTYKEVQEALASQGVKVHTSTIGRHVRAYRERLA